MTENKKTAIITGASRGIGRATAIEFAKNGYNVVLNSRRSKKELEKLSSYVIEEFNVDAPVMVGNVGEYGFVKDMISDAVSRFKRIDVLVNNAGISNIGLASEFSIDEFNEIMSVNFNSVFYTCKELIPHFVHYKSGKIINVSSIWGEVGASCESVYSASKGAVISFSKALAKELALSGIAVNVVSPGVIDTKMNDCFDENEINNIIEEIPAGRMGKASEVGKIIFELSKATPFLTGQVIRIDGGMI